jgi:hypothetical protein
MADLKIDIATVFSGKKAFGQAETATQKLTGSVKSLGRALGVTFGAALAVNYLKRSARAAVEAQAQTDRLTKLLRVTVMATDDQIRAIDEQSTALERLGVVTKGNIQQVQSQLATFNLQTTTIQALTPAILDYVTAEKGATASTADFKSMTNGLAQALNGNFASLTRVGFVIDDVTRKTIKNGNESERVAAIVGVLDSTYKGFNESLRDTPVGQMQLLTNAAEDALTVIGGGLLEALGAAGGTGGLTGSLEGIAKLAATISDLFVGIGRTVAAVSPFFDGSNLFSAIAQYRRITAGFREQDRIAGLGSGITPAISAELKKAAVEKASLKLSKEKTKAITKQTKAIKEQTALQKANTLFDLEKTQIIAALNGEISKDERRRLELQLAILTGNTDEASKLAGQLAKSQGLTQEMVNFLRDLPDAKNPFSAWQSYLNQIEAQVRRIASGGVGGGTGSGGGSGFVGAPIMPKSITGGTTISSNDFPVAAMSGGAAVGQGGDVYVEVVIDGQKVAGAVSSYQTNNYLSGYRIDLNRDLGTFL